MGKGGYGVAKSSESENRREGYMMSCIRNPDGKRAKWVTVWNEERMRMDDDLTGIRLIEVPYSPRPFD